MLDLILEVYDYLIIALSILIPFILLLFKLTKNNKLRKLYHNLLIIKGVVKKNMYTAEEFFNYAGQDKKEWVKTKVNQYCIENGIKYDENEVETSIEEFIEVSKTINKKEEEESDLL